jgi:hypothetical protein
MGVNHGRSFSCRASDDLIRVILRVVTFPGGNKNFTRLRCSVLQVRYNVSIWALSSI